MVDRTGPPTVGAGKPAGRPFDPQQLAVGVSAGLITAVLALGAELSLAALIFSGPLAGYTAYGIGLVLIGVAAMNIVLALLSRQPPQIAAVQEAPVAVVALLAADVAAGVAAGEANYATVIAAIALSTLATGVAFLLLGQFRLGSLSRYLPYPVVGGFLAGTGWLLALGGIGIMTNVQLELATLPALFAPPTVWSWLPGMAFGVLILVALRRNQHILILPGMLVGATALFYVWLALSGRSIADAQAGGLLLGPFPAGAAWAPLSPAMLALVDWQAILGQAGAIGTAATISVIGLLLNVSGLQLARQEDLDLNQELRANGVAQLVAGAISSPPGFTTLSLSLLGHRMGARSPVPGLVLGLSFVLLFFFGIDLLGLVPRLVLGGVVCYLGLALLTEWLYDSGRQLPGLDYGLIVAILLLIILFGILAGVVGGLVIAIVLFVVAYSRVEVVKHTLSGATIKSRMTRGYAEQQRLRELGDQIAVFQLQGFLFFGTAHDLQERVRERLIARDQPPLRFALLDFRLVPRIDSTAILSFSRLLQLADSCGTTLVLTQLAPAVERPIRRRLLTGPDSGRVRIFPSLDHGLEWCENELLAGPGGIAAPPAGLAGPSLDLLLGLFERRSFAAGEYLIRQGDDPDAMYFIESGQVTAQIESAGRPPSRLESMRDGRMVGELGFFLGTRRTAAVVADEPCVVRRITRQALDRLKQERPEAAAAFNELVARLLSERVVHLINTVDALQR